MSNFLPSFLPVIILGCIGVRIFVVIFFMFKVLISLPLAETDVPGRDDGQDQECCVQKGLAAESYDLEDDCPDDPLLGLEDQHDQ